MAIAHVASTSAAFSDPGGTTTAIDTTGATLIVVSVSSYTGGTLPTVSDSKGNSYTGLTSRAGGGPRHRLFYCLAPTVGSGHTVTVSGASLYPAVFVRAFSGVASYQTESGVQANNVTSLASGSVTPSADGALIVTANSGWIAVTDSVTPGGFTLETIPRAGNLQGSVAWYVQPTAAAINPTWGFSPMQTDVAIGTAVFLPTAPTGAPLRASQLAAELVLLVPAAPVSTTQLASEILLALTPNDARVTALACELIVIRLPPSSTCPVDFAIDPD